MSESFDVVCRYDEAIDPDASDKARFRETLDAKHLRYMPGERPTVFHCRRLRTSEMVEVARQPDDASRFKAAFSLGIVRVTDRRVGEDRLPWVRSIPDEKALNDRALDDFDFADVMEVGAAIWGRCHLGKGRPAAWPLPATSAHAIGATASRRVERMIGSARSPTSNEPAATAPAPSSSPGGATPGGVTATASSAPSP